MRYLRMLTNAVAGGVLMALYLTMLVFEVNPQLPVVSLTALRWTGAVTAFYAPYISVALFFLILGLDLVSPHPLRPGWLSVRLLAWLGAVGTGAAAALTWANLASFSAVLSDTAAERMRAAAWATTATAGALLTIAVLRYSFGRRGSRAVGTLLVVTLVLSVAAPMWLRGPGDVPVPLPRPAAGEQHPRLERMLGPLRFAPRVRIFAFDGGSLGFIRQRVAAGQLPNFGRLLDRGATIDLATLKPTQAEPIWAAAATGKSPQRNGIRSNATYRVSSLDAIAADILPDYCFASALPDQGFLERTGPVSSMLAARPMWDILVDYGVASGVAGWPLTYPARAERGYVLSDRFDDAASEPLRLRNASAGYPTTAVDVGREIFDAWQAASRAEILPTLPAGGADPLGLNQARWDRAYQESAAALEQQFAPKLTAVRYEGLAAFGHSYLRDAQPELFGDPGRVDPQRSVLDHYYAFLDGEVGRAARLLAPGDLLIVMSGFGMQPTSVTKRLLARLLARQDVSGTHEPAPDGFLMAYGSHVASGQFARGTIVDLAPTVLYYLGVDVGKDMDGFARTDLFLPTYVLEHPVKYVASHER
jgi:hypothetical protein